MKKGKTLQINLSNKVFYTLVSIAFVIVLGVGVFASTYVGDNGVGHDLSELQACGNKQYLSYNEYLKTWQCVTGNLMPNKCDVVGQIAKYSGSGWVCADMPFTENFAGDIALAVDSVSTNSITSRGNWMNIPSGSTGWVGQITWGDKYRNNVDHLLYVNANNDKQLVLDVNYGEKSGVNPTLKIDGGLDVKYELILGSNINCKGSLYTDSSGVVKCRQSRICQCALGSYSWGPEGVECTSTGKTYSLNCK